MVRSSPRDYRDVTDNLESGRKAWYSIPGCLHTICFNNEFCQPVISFKMVLIAGYF